MALKAPSFIPQPWATNGQAATIPDQKPKFGRASWSQGFPTETSIPLKAGGIPPNYLDFQGVLKTLSQFAFFQQSGGLFTWSSKLDYLKGCHVLGSNGHEYIAQRPSGPDIPASGGGFVGAVDPTADPKGFWLDFTESLRRYDICEFYYFRNPAMRPGFVRAAGGLIPNAATLYPEAWAYLQTTKGKKLCKTEAEWQAMSTAIYYTNADGVSEGWNGVGGVPWFVIDTNAGTIRVPDIRGMYAEAAGLDSLNVGGVHADRVRKVKTASNVRGDAKVSFAPNYGSGAIFGETVEYGYSMAPGADASWNLAHVKFDLSRSIPTGSHTAPRAFGTLACVYLGV